VQPGDTPDIYFEVNICEATYSKCTVEEVMEENA